MMCRQSEPSTASLAHSGSATIRRPVASLICLIAGIGALASIHIDLWLILHTPHMNGRGALACVLWLIVGPILGPLLVFRSPLVGLNRRDQMVSIRSFLSSKKLPIHAIVAIRPTDIHIGKVAFACPGLVTRLDEVVPITPLARLYRGKRAEAAIQRSLEQVSAFLSVAIEHPGTDVGEFA